jgi:hypothetical protein
LRLNKPSSQTFSFFLLVGILITLFSVSCATNPGIILPQSTPKQSEPVNYFPVQRGDHGISLLMSFEGKLIVEDGYIRAKSLFPSENVLVIWPKGYSLVISDQMTEILNNKGKAVAKVGDNIEMTDMSSGAGIDVFDLKTGQTIPEDSIKDKKPFWYAWDVEFFPFFRVIWEILSEPKNLIILINLKPLLKEFLY